MKTTLLKLLFSFFILLGIDSFANDTAIGNLDCPTVSISYPSAQICNSNTTPQAVILSGTGIFSGGTFTVQPSGLVIDSMSGTILPSSNTEGVFTITYTIPPSPGCPSYEASTIVTIVDEPYAGTPTGSIAVCDNSTETIDLYSLLIGEDLGGSWTRVAGSGGIFNAVAGTFRVLPGTTNTIFAYTVAGSAPCPSDTEYVTINVNPMPYTGTGGSVTVAETSTSTIDLFSLLTGAQPGGTWIRPTGTGGTFSSLAGAYTPAIGSTTSTFIYSLMGIAPCGNASTTVIVYIQPNLSSTDFTATKFSISPNPVQDFMNIESDFAISKIKIFNQIGQLVLEKEVNATQAHLDLSFMSSGLYNVLLETEKGVETTKIIKE